MGETQFSNTYQILIMKDCNSVRHGNRQYIFDSKFFYRFIRIHQIMMTFFLNQLVLSMFRSHLRLRYNIQYIDRKWRKCFLEKAGEKIFFEFEKSKDFLAAFICIVSTSMLSLKLYQIAFVSQLVMIFCMYHTNAALTVCNFNINKCY